MRTRLNQQSLWVPAYTTGISVIGLTVAILAATRPGIDWTVVLLFGGMAGLAEILSVQQVVPSRISVASALIMASILVIGPFAGMLVAVIHGILSGIFTVVTAYLRHQSPKPGQAPWFQRLAFNTGMLVVVAAIAGTVFVALGGTPGAVLKFSNVLPLAMAAVTYPLTNLALLMGVLHLKNGRSPIDLWRQDFRWTVPIEFLVDFLAGGALAVGYALFRVGGALVFLLPILATGYAYLFTVRRERAQVAKLEALNRSLDEANQGLSEALAEVIDAYDAYTLGHSRQVTTYAEAIAEKMGLSQDERNRIRRAALIHDIGKVGISESIISKGGRLTEEEYNFVKMHPDIGAEIVAQMKGLEDLVPLVRHHHERWDGQGYPDMLAGEQIPLGARIISLADALEAMCSDRPHSRARTFPQVLAEIRRCSGSQFDPTVVGAFFDLAAETGDKLFMNSAAIVDRSSAMTELARTQSTRRYLKKSMRLE